MSLSKENQKKRGAFYFLCGHIDDKENAGETFGRTGGTPKQNPSADCNRQVLTPKALHNGRVYYSTTFDT